MKKKFNPHITDTIVVSDFRNVNVAGSDLIGLMNQKNHTIFMTQCYQFLLFNQMWKNRTINLTREAKSETLTWCLIKVRHPTRRKIAIYGKSTREALCSRTYYIHRSKSGNGDSKTAGCSSWLIIPKKCFNFTFSPVIKIEALTILFGLCPSRG